MDELNPYEPPRSIERDWIGANDSNQRSRTATCFAWLVVGIANLPIPLLFGSFATERGGRTGMVVAILAFLAAGWWLCANTRKVGTAIVIGAIPLALGQAVPIAQVFAGVVALTVGRRVGLVTAGDRDGLGYVVGEFGGLVVTLLTGAILLLLCGCFGVLVQRFIPNRWRQRPEKTAEA